MAGIELISAQGLRVDGRRHNELRKIHCRLGVFGQAEGSAYLEQGNTKVLAAVYGPHEIRGSRLKLQHDKVNINCQYSMATFSTAERKRRPRGDLKSREMTMHLQQTFEGAIQTELYPRSQIDIFVEVLQADGGNYSACVNAATLALIDAGIPMREFVCSCTTGLVDDVPLLDVSHIESTMSGAQLTVAVLPKSGEIVMLEMSSQFHMDYLTKVLDAAVQGSKDIYHILNAAVKDYVGKAALLQQ